jgi:hypothetical protein
MKATWLERLHLIMRWNHYAGFSLPHFIEYYLQVIEAIFFLAAIRMRPQDTEIKTTTRRPS